MFSWKFIFIISEFFSISENYKRIHKKFSHYLKELQPRVAHLRNLAWVFQYIFVW